VWAYMEKETRNNKGVKYFVIFSIGGFLYYIIETAWRAWRGHGETHWLMFVIGGLMLIGIGSLNENKKYNLPLTTQMIAGALMITTTELIVGFALDKLWGIRIWNYSGMVGSIGGYTSLTFSIAWLPISLMAVFLDDFIRWFIFDERFPKYKM
jgi:uncharacterized membrane protein